MKNVPLPSTGVQGMGSFYSYRPSRVADLSVHVDRKMSPNGGRRACPNVGHDTCAKPENIEEGPNQDKTEESERLWTNKFHPLPQSLCSMTSRSKEVKKGSSRKERVDNLRKFISTGATVVPQHLDFGLLSCSSDGPCRIHGIRLENTRQLLMGWRKP